MQQSINIKCFKKRYFIYFESTFSFANLSKLSKAACPLFIIIPLNTPFSLVKSSSGEAYSAICPFTSTIILSYCIIVLTLWAIVITVDYSINKRIDTFLNSFFIMRCKTWSVASSILAVASSIIKIFGCLRIALAIHNNCLSPELKLPPFSCTSYERISFIFSSVSSDLLC